MAFLKLCDIYGDASALVIVDGSETSFGELSAPFSEVTYSTLGFKPDLQEWELWRWDGSAPAPANPAESRLARLMGDDTTLRIYEFTSPNEDGLWGDWHQPPLGLDYRRGITARLQREFSTIVKGEIQEVKYWASSTVNPDGSLTYADLVVSESITYNRDAYGFALSRTQVIAWYDRAGNAHPTTKTRTKIYEVLTERREEGIKKRRLNTDAIEMLTIGAMVAQSSDPASVLNGLDYSGVVDRGKELLKQYSGEKAEYINEETSAFKDGVNLHDILADPDAAWLDEAMPGAGGITFRQYIVSELS